jgi:hypothetical protein
MQKDVLTQIMAFGYSAAHYLGTWIAALIERILPNAKGIATLADPIGYLAIITILVVITATVKKVAVIIVVVGWALILLRIVLMAFGV